MALAKDSNRSPISSTATKDNKSKWLRLSEITGIPQTRLIDKALELLFKQYEEQGKNLTGE